MCFQSFPSQIWADVTVWLPSEGGQSPKHSASEIARKRKSLERGVSKVHIGMEKLIFATKASGEVAYVEL